MARQRYCRRLARYRNTLRVSADPVAKPAADTRAESRGSRPSNEPAIDDDRVGALFRHPKRSEQFLGVHLLFTAPAGTSALCDQIANGPFRNLYTLGRRNGDRLARLFLRHPGFPQASE